ncbi:MAG: 16S rRNA (uracil(1498)-N(3))-methyltransferase [Burkholderiales bacterium]|nr:16S rRNA (uracil(1498)-N(3))-methyltransferase [Burkholderiales bacterium]
MKKRSNPLTRIYFPDPIPDHGRCRLAPAKSHHLVQVLRLDKGDPVVLFDGQGVAHEAVITDCARGAVSVQVGARLDEQRESPLRVILAQALSSGERMDFTIQKAVELGVSAIQPLLTERCVVRLAGERAEKKQTHWQGVVIASCEQCGRNVVPGVSRLLGLRDWLQQPGPADGLRLLLMPGADATLRQLPRPTGAITVLAGPEGGLSPTEIDDAVRAGFTPLRLGPRVLRTETAAVALLAAMQALWGDF